MKNLCTNEPFVLESGEVIPTLNISYHTFGQLNNDKSNVVWVFHALTGNSNPIEWWPDIIGEGKVIDPNHDFIICSNTLGSSYGTTSPTSINPTSDKLYGDEFPFITIRDIVKAQKVLQKHLNLQKIQLGIGGSMGGQILLEWAIEDPNIFEGICLLATNAKMSPWAIALNETQRMALELSQASNSSEGLKIARAIALLSYRSYEIYNQSQNEISDHKTDHFKASSYQQYQGEKFWNRFNLDSYQCLTKAMDSHNVGRNRNGIINALKKIKAKTIIFGIQSDGLFPIQEQKELKKHISKAQLKIIRSPYGHDGFLTETKIISKALRRFRNKRSSIFSFARPLFNYSNFSFLLPSKNIEII